MEPSRIIVPNHILLGEVMSMLSEGKDVTILTKGQSMLPFIIGDRDRVRLRRLERVDVGDIVLAVLPGGQYVLHRVLEKDGDRLTLMGDGNLRGVEHCSLPDVCGTALTRITPDGKELSLRSASSLRRSRVWLRLKPCRRVILALYKRTVLKILK